MGSSCGSGPGVVSSRPAAAVTSTSSAVADSGTSVTRVAVRSSRVPRPPARSRLGGSAAQDRRSRSTVPTTAAAASAPAPSRSPPGGGDTGTAGGARCSAPAGVRPRTARPISRGSSTVVGSMATSRPRESRASTGLRAASRRTTRCAPGVVPTGGPGASRSSTACSAAGKPASSRASRASSVNIASSAARAPARVGGPSRALAEARMRRVSTSSAASRFAAGRPSPSGCWPQRSLAEPITCSSPSAS